MANLNIISRVENKDEFELSRNFRVCMNAMEKSILKNRKLHKKNKRLNMEDLMIAHFFVVISDYLELNELQYTKYLDKIYEMAKIANSYITYKFQDKWR